MSATHCDSCGKPWIGHPGIQVTCAESINGAAMIVAERRRQVQAEGFDAGHDIGYKTDQLAWAATVYACPHGLMRQHLARLYWPWSSDWYKPKDRIRDLVKAGALIAAEIDRLQAEAAQAAKDKP